MVVVASLELELEYRYIGIVVVVVLVLPLLACCNGYHKKYEVGAETQIKSPFSK